MQQRVYLRSEQRDMLQTPKQLYVYLKMINYVEKYYSFDKIDAATHKAQITKLLEKYNRCKMIIPNYSLQQFKKKYNIPQEEISWAQLVLKNGIGSQDPTKQASLYIQATAKFCQVLDLLDIYKDNPVVGDIRTNLQELQMILKKLQNKLGGQFIYKFQQYETQLRNYVQSKTITQCLAENQLKQIQHSVKMMYSIMQIITKT